MRRLAHVVAPGLLPVLIVGLLAASPAEAQVTVNPGALDLLPQPSRPAPRIGPGPTRPATRTPSSAKPAAGSVPTVPAAPQAVAPKPAVPVLPVVPPAIAALPPPAPVPPARPQAAPVVPVAADAPGSATPFGGGVRVTFGPMRQELNPTTEAALRDLARRVRANEAITVNVYAYAAGTAEDPSTARRLSLARALAARAVLVNEGIASTRIYPRALGTAGGDTDRDRVDVVPGMPGPPSPTVQAPAR